MKSVIVGTAGHIDHGKTALVKALTGIDADRLEEEKRRGITIDIGFAHLELTTVQGEKLRLGFVDVPGHERFVRNMLAGVGGIDLVLLVIAADEGVKPQTREHFDICRMLNIRRGITVVTKPDLVDTDTLEVLKLEIEDFVRGSFLDGAPIVAVSSLQRTGLDELKQTLARIAAEAPTKDSRAPFRLPIDRVFTMKGHGTVITGTLLSGRVKKEEELEVFPTGRRVRVRGVQVHGRQADEALAGQRTALNLAGATLEELARGMTLAAPGLFRKTSRVDARLSLLSTAKPLKDRARVHLHVHTAEAIAEVVLIAEDSTAGSGTRSGAANAPFQAGVAMSGEEGAAAPARQLQLAPGHSSYAQLRLDAPLLLLPGDRFIIRQFSPVLTIGGGVVVDAAPLSRRRIAEARPFLEIVTNGTREQVLLARIARRGAAGLGRSGAVAETGWLLADVDSSAQKLGREIVKLGETFVSADAFSSSKADAVGAVNAFHNANPLVAGISKEQLREQLDLAPEVFAGVLNAVVAERKLGVSGEQVHAAGRGVQLKDDEAESKQIIEKAFSSAGVQVPYLKDVLASLKIDKTRAQKIVTLLMRDRILIKVNEDLVFHRDTLEQLKAAVRAHKAKSPSVDVATFKDLFGITRKYAIPLLEYLDRERVTRRVGDARVIL
jgi:selenocysteine-specific elongation factor